MGGDRAAVGGGRAAPAGDQWDLIRVVGRVRILEVAEDAPPVAVGAAHRSGLVTGDEVRGRVDRRVGKPRHPILDVCVTVDRVVLGVQSSGARTDRNAWITVIRAVGGLQLAVRDRERDVEGPVAVPRVELLEGQASAFEIGAATTRREYVGRDRGAADGEEEEVAAVSADADPRVVDRRVQHARVLTDAVDAVWLYHERRTTRGGT